MIPTLWTLLLPAWYRRCHCLCCCYDTANTSTAAMIPLHPKYCRWCDTNTVTSAAACMLILPLPLTIIINIILLSSNGINGMLFPFTKGFDNSHINMHSYQERDFYQHWAVVVGRCIEWYYHGGHKWQHWILSSCHHLLGEHTGIEWAVLSFLTQLIPLQLPFFAISGGEGWTFW